MSSPSEQRPQAVASPGAESPAGSIVVHVNGAPHACAPGSTIAELLAALSIQGRVAVALDRDVVPRSQFALRTIENGDRVEILEAVGGG